MIQAMDKVVEKEMPSYPEKQYRYIIVYQDKKYEMFKDPKEAKKWQMDNLIGPIQDTLGEDHEYYPESFEWLPLDDKVYKAPAWRLHLYDKNNKEISLNKFKGISGQDIRQYNVKDFGPNKTLNIQLRANEGYTQVTDMAPGGKVSVFTNEYGNKLEPSDSKIKKVTQLKEDLEEDEKTDEEPKTIYDYLVDLEKNDGMTPGQLNTTLQSLFGMFNHIFILTSDIYNQDPDEDQYLYIDVDEDSYTITYRIVDIVEPKIKIIDVDID